MASNYLEVNQNEPLGLVALQIRDLLLQAMSKADELGEALGQAAADDQTNAKLASVVGMSAAADAVALKNLVRWGSLRVNFADGGNAFAQYTARVNRAGI